MSTQPNDDPELEQRMASGLMDVLIRAGLILVMVLVCFRVFSPFLNLMICALILAVTLYPMQVWLSATRCAGSSTTSRTTRSRCRLRERASRTGR
jgi:predicted PurR-regulated permease PerM